MNYIVEFVKYRKDTIILFLTTVIIYSVIGYLGELNSEVTNYAMKLSSTVFIMYMIVSFLNFRKKISALEGMVSRNRVQENKNMDTVNSGAVGINLNSTRTEDISFLSNSSVFDRLYFELIEREVDITRNIKTESREKINELSDYFTIWMHQIKTPISAIDLINQSSEINSKDKNSIKQELIKIESYTKMALNYVKINDISMDIDFETVNMEMLVKKIVKQYSILFIYNNIKLIMEDLDFEVLTDKKWLGLVIEQILSNSIKYAKGGNIRIYRDKNRNKCLIIEDDGKGIRPEDLPRMFSKGFSGVNGRSGLNGFNERNSEYSTGLGLFLSKKIMDKLSNKIWIESDLGKGTKVYLDLDKELFEAFD